MVLLGNRANGDPVAPIAAAEDAVHVMRLVEAMGLIEPSGPLEEFGTEALRRVAEAAAAYGIGRDLARVIVDPRATDGQRHRALGLLRAALEESPAPRPEARSLLQLFGPDRLGALGRGAALRPRPPPAGGPGGAGPRTTSPAGSTCLPGSSGSCAARTTTRASGAGSSVGARPLTIGHHRSCSRAPGTPRRPARAPCWPSPVRSTPPRRRDRLPARRSPPPVPLGGSRPAARPLARRRRGAGPLPRGDPRRGLGRVPAPRGDRRPPGPGDHPAGHLGDRGAR